MQAGMDARPHTETCRARLEEELAKGDNRRWKNAKNREMVRTATDAALVRVREEREKRRKHESPDFELIGNPSLEERASRAKIEAKHVEHGKPSSIETRGHVFVGCLNTKIKMKLRNNFMQMIRMIQMDIWMSARV